MEAQLEEATKPQTPEERQLALEAEMTDMGIERYWREVERAKERQAESDTKYGQRLMGEILEKLVPAIKEFLRKTGGKGKGGTHSSIKYLKQLRPETAAYLATRTVLDGLSIELPLTALAIRIASCVEDEVRFMGYNRLDDRPKRNYYRKTSRALQQQTGNAKVRRRAIKGTMKRIGAPDWDNWSTQDKVHLGVKLIELIAGSLSIIHIVTRYTRKNRSQDCVEPTQEGRDWIKSFNEYHDDLTPQYLPMVIPPQHWSTPYDGGYLSPHLKRRLTLVKTPYRDYLEEISHCEMDPVYTGVNALQDTAWKVHERLYLVLRKLWNRGSVVGKLPPRDDEPRPTKPADIDTNREARIQWRKQASQVEKRNVKLASKRLQVSRTIMIAKKFMEEREIYFPYQLDFRGRAYCIPMFLHPQGPDYAKALLTFARGKPITTKEAAEWLAIHGANMFGYDKVSFPERLKWVKDNERWIRESAEAPTDVDWWTKADKPWQFLAWCFEYNDFLKTGMGFVSSLPIALDGSCNGLQHFSAMLRDEVGGKAVNLLPSEKPQDIYQTVCDLLIAKLKILAAGGCHEAKQWLAFGLSRKDVKRCVMVLPYGGTLYAFRKYLQERIAERLEGGEKNPFGLTFDQYGRSRFFKPAAYLADVLNEAIGETVQSAVQAMAWLQAVAELVAADGTTINWVTPTGFPVLQAYRKTDSRLVDTQIFGKVKQLCIRKEQESQAIDTRKQANGIAPNFVHSLDAAAMMFCLADSVAQDDPIESFAMIHDSYGTVAADTERLAVILRFAFVHQVYNTDVLQAFAESVKELLPEGKELPSLPKKGTLDLTKVEESLFFFA